MPVQECMSEADLRQPAKLRISVSHPVLGVLAAGKAVTEAEFASLRDDLRLSLMPEGECHAGSPGPFAVLVLSMPPGWMPTTEFDAPHDVMSDPTSREDATRKAIRFNRVQMERGWVKRWACVRISGAGARVLIVPIAGDWMPETEFDFPPVLSEGHSQREAKRIARQFNIEQLESGNPSEWALPIRHLVEDVAELAFAGGKGVQA